MDPPREAQVGQWSASAEDEPGVDRMRTFDQTQTPFAPHLTSGVMEEFSPTGYRNIGMETQGSMIDYESFEYGVTGLQTWTTTRQNWLTPDASFKKRTSRPTQVSTDDNFYLLVITFEHRSK